MHPRIARFLAGGAAAAILAGAAGATAQAQSVPTAPNKPIARAEADAFLSVLAAKLGKTSDEVRAATKSAEHDLVTRAVQAGKLSQEKAARLNQRIDQSNGLPFRHGIGPGPRGTDDKGAAGAQPGFGHGELAKFLGVAPKVLKTELESGKSLSQVAQAHGKTGDQLKTFVRDQAKARMDERVKAGKLTQSQADAALKRLTDNLDQMVNRAPPAHGKGGRGGPPKKAALSF